MGNDFGVALCWAPFLIAGLICEHIDKRKAQRRYEQARLAYSRERMTKIHNLEM